MITDHRLARCNVASFPRAATRAEAVIGDLGLAVQVLRTSPDYGNFTQLMTALLTTPKRKNTFLLIYTTLPTKFM